MAVTIGDLQVDTKATPGTGEPKQPEGGAKSPSTCDLQSAVERMKERESRLCVD